MDRTIETTAQSPVGAPTHRDRGCLVAGCPCKDARIVSTRRARFFATVARLRGETADRVVVAEPDWAIPASIDLVLRPSFGALA